MHFTIDAKCRRGLRVIGDVPNISLCRIEGYNGIGKTSAIRLLQLCSGSQPFSDATPAWRTFRTQLVHAQISIRDLNGAHQIEWDIEPANWPEIPEILGDRIGAVKIDGR